MIIPPDQLEAETLNTLIEHYVLGEGTEYGAKDYSLAEKVASVQKQIQTGDVLIVWSQTHETINLVAKSQLSWTSPDTS